MILPGKKSGALISRVLLCSVSMAPRWRQAGKSNLDYEADKAETVVVLTSSDDEEANEDLSLAIVEKAKRSKANRSFEAALVNISSDDAEAGKEEDGIGGEESRKKKEIIVAAETETFVRFCHGMSGRRQSQARFQNKGMACLRNRKTALSVQTISSRSKPEERRSMPERGRAICRHCPRRA